jgi:hypothetical protein
MNKNYETMSLVEKLEELTTLKTSLSNLANSLGGKDTGMIAALIHQATSKLISPKKYLSQRIETGVTPPEAGNEAFECRIVNQVKELFGDDLMIV